MDEINLFYEELNIKIRNHSFASNTIFSPYRPIKIYIDNNSNLTVNKDEIYFTQEGIYNNEAYNLQVARPLPYGKLLSLNPEKRKKDIEDIDIYLQIPENKITKNTINLVKRIVKDLDGDFEKSKAIENYLRENYDYTTEVDQVPEGYDFVDYFLFQSQKGYCTYFASSLAIMLRLEGIPTRYVEGYLAHEISQEGVLEVRQRNAHAWVEAFIEPVGWMIFEATPPFPIEDRLESYSSLSQSSDLDREGNSSIYNSLDTDYDYLENHEDFYIIETGDYPSTESSYKSFFKYLFYIIIILLSLFPLKFIYTAIYISYRKYIARNLNNHKKTIFLYSQILKLIENLGYPQQTGETHLEYAHRIVRRFYTNIDTDEDISIKTVVNIFMKAKYGEIPIHDDEIDKLLEFKSMLEKQLKFYWGKPSYYFRKYLRLKEYFIY